MQKQLFFREAMAGLGKYCTGGYSRIGSYWIKGQGRNTCRLDEAYAQSVLGSFIVGDVKPPSLFSHTFSQWLQRELVERRQNPAKMQRGHIAFTV